MYTAVLQLVGHHYLINEQTVKMCNWFRNKQSIWAFFVVFVFFLSTIYLHNGIFIFFLKTLFTGLGTCHHSLLNKCFTWSSVHLTSDLLTMFIGQVIYFQFCSLNKAFTFNSVHWTSHLLSILFTGQLTYRHWKKSEFGFYTFKALLLSLSIYTTRGIWGHLTHPTGIFQINQGP